MRQQIHITITSENQVAFSSSMPEAQLLPQCVELTCFGLERCPPPLFQLLFLSPLYDSHPPIILAPPYPVSQFPLLNYAFSSQQLPFFIIQSRSFPLSSLLPQLHRSYVSLISTLLEPYYLSPVPTLIHSSLLPISSSCVF